MLLSAMISLTKSFRAPIMGLLSPPVCQWSRHCSSRPANVSFYMKNIDSLVWSKKALVRQHNHPCLLVNLPMLPSQSSQAWQTRWQTQELSTSPWRIPALISGRLSLRVLNLGGHRSHISVHTINVVPWNSSRVILYVHRRLHGRSDISSRQRLFLING